MNPKGNRHLRRFAGVIATLGLFCSAPAMALADPSNTNHGSDNGISHASATGLANSNVNGIGTTMNGTAPVPETSTYVAMATLVAAAAYARRRRRVAQQ